MDQKIDETFDKPALTPALENEWTQLLTTMQTARTNNQDLSPEFYTQLRQLYRKILHHWSLTHKPVLCTHCHHSLLQHEDPNSWTFEYSTHKSLPIFKFWCQPCKTWTTEQYETVH